MKQVIIYGAGGFGRELAWLVESCAAEVACFVDDNQSIQGTDVNGIPVLTLRDARTRFPSANLVSSLGSPKSRQCSIEQARAVGFRFETLVHPRVEHSSWIDWGVGTVVCAGSILTTNIRVGQHVQINLDCTIGHDVVIGDYSTLAPGVHISGNVHLGERVYVGTGAVIINGTPHDPITIGDDVVIGAAACVTKSVPAGATVVGVPARVVENRPTGRLRYSSSEEPCSNSNVRP